MRIHERSSDSPPIVWLSLRRTVQFYVEYTYILFVTNLSIVIIAAVENNP